jgi:hypothetical protein
MIQKVTASEVTARKSTHLRVFSEVAKCKLSSLAPLDATTATRGQCTNPYIKLIN